MKTDTELRDAEKNHDAVYNEGGEGYNPYRDEREARERKQADSMPKDRESEIVHELSILDCAIARESGTHNMEKIAALRAELAALQLPTSGSFYADLEKANL